MVKKMKKKGLTSKQMSKLYKGIKSKGNTHNYAFKVTGTAKKLSIKLHNNKWKKGKFGKYANYDFDGDKKVNKYDCFPFDKNRQDAYNFESLGVNNKILRDSEKSIKKDLRDTPLSIGEIKRNALRDKVFTETKKVSSKIGKKLYSGTKNLILQRNMDRKNKSLVKDNSKTLIKDLSTFKTKRVMTPEQKKDYKDKKRKEYELKKKKIEDGSLFISDISGASNKLGGRKVRPKVTGVKRRKDVKLGKIVKSNFKGLSNINLPSGNFKKSSYGKDREKLRLLYELKGGSSKFGGRKVRPKITGVKRRKDLELSKPITKEMKGLVGFELPRNVNKSKSRLLKKNLKKYKGVSVGSLGIKPIKRKKNPLYMDEY